jgi:hypothetical protein
MSRDNNDTLEMQMKEQETKTGLLEKTSCILQQIIMLTGNQVRQSTPHLSIFNHSDVSISIHQYLKRLDRFC